MSARHALIQILPDCWPNQFSER